MSSVIQIEFTDVIVGGEDGLAFCEANHPGEAVQKAGGLFLEVMYDDIWDYISLPEIILAKMKEQASAETALNRGSMCLGRPDSSQG